MAKRSSQRYCKINSHSLPATTNPDYEFDCLDISNVNYHGIIDQQAIERLAVLARFVGIQNPSPKDAVDAFISRIRSIQKEIGEPLR
jgi:hypothetical protein